MKELIWIYLVNEGMKKIMEVDILGKWKTNASTFSIIKKNQPTNKQTNQNNDLFLICCSDEYIFF